MTTQRVNALSRGSVVNQLTLILAATHNRQRVSRLPSKKRDVSRVAEGQDYLPPPPSSNRTDGFPVSGFTGSSQTLACMGRHPLPEMGIRFVVGPLGKCPSLHLSSEHNSVVGLPQAVLLTSYEGIDPAGALCSMGVTPLPRYYGPLRLPAKPHGGY